MREIGALGGYPTGMEAALASAMQHKEQGMRRFSKFMKHWSGPIVAAVLLSGCGPSGKLTSEPAVETQAKHECAYRDLKPVWIQEHVAPNLVRIIADGNTSGTGFLLAPPVNSNADPVVVTNHHVVAGGMEFQAEVQTSKGEWVRMSNIEVIKADPKNDLVLMKVPKISARAMGLRLSTERTVVGQEIAVLGFPGVAQSEFVLTLETGSISAVRTIDGHEYLTTNANINSGNSGGPMVDACGNVVGVVVAKMTTTERTGLSVPGSKLADLYKAHLKPRVDDESDIRARLGEFMIALEYHETVEAAAFMSRTFLLGKVAPIFLSNLKNCMSKIDEEAHKFGRHVETLSAEEFGPISKRVLSQSEITLMYLGMLMSNGHINQFQALQVYFSEFVSDLFGDVHGHRISRVRKRSDNHYDVHVELQNKGETSHWVFNMEYTWGEWSIENMGPL